MRDEHNDPLAQVYEQGVRAQDELIVSLMVRNKALRTAIRQALVAYEAWQHSQDDTASVAAIVTPLQEALGGG